MPKSASSHPSKEADCSVSPRLKYSANSLRWKAERPQPAWPNGIRAQTCCQIFDSAAPGSVNSSSRQKMTKVNGSALLSMNRCSQLAGNTRKSSRWMCVRCFANSNCPEPRATQQILWKGHRSDAISKPWAWWLSRMRTCPWGTVTSAARLLRKS